jgi:hypothetical protein
MEKQQKIVYMTEKKRKLCKEWTLGETSWFETNSTPYMWPNQKVEQKTNWLRLQKYFEI